MIKKEDGLSRSGSRGLSRLGTALRKGGAMLSRSNMAVVQRIAEPQGGAPLLRSASSASRSRKVGHGLLRLRREGEADAAGGSDSEREEDEVEEEEWREDDAGERDTRDARDARDAHDAPAPAPAQQRQEPCGARVTAQHRVAAQLRPRSI